MSARLLGIVNVTPDSFSDGGQFFDAAAALAQAAKLRAEGATWVDVGAESTRPGATPVPPAQEWERLAPVLRSLIKQHPGVISLDTRNAATAERFLQLGGTIINDVSGAQAPRMRAIVAQHGATIIVNHFPGATIAQVHEQHIDSINQVADELHLRVQQLRKAGVPHEKIILDPGIGFGKTPALNQQLLGFAAHMPEHTVLIGHSKKRFLGEHRKEKAPNVAAAQVAIAGGAAWLRVHNPGWFADLVGAPL